MAQTARVRCPSCGTEMNHHADKVDYDAALDDPEARDPALGGIVQEVHQCPSPRCGRIEMRRARTD